MRGPGLIGTGDRGRSGPQDPADGHHQEKRP